MTEETSWYDSLPEEIQGAPIFKRGDDGEHKTLEQTVLDLTNLAQVAGNSLRMPGPDAGDEDIQKFQSRVMEKIPGLMTTPNPDDPDSIGAHFLKMGKPEEPEGYKIPDIEGFELSDPGTIKAQAHAMNMTQAQFTEMINAQAAGSTSAQEARTAAISEQQNILKEEWGGAHEQRNDAVGHLLKTVGAPEEVIEAFDGGELSAGMMRFMYKLTELADEGSTIDRQDGGREGILAPSEALDQLAEIENQLFAPNMRPGMEGYQRLADKRMKLMTQAYPDASVDIDAMRA